MKELTFARKSWLVEEMNPIFLVIIPYPYFYYSHGLFDNYQHNYISYQYKWIIIAIVNGKIIIGENTV